MIILITVILTVRYWWHIKYQLFLLFNRRQGQKHHLIDHDDDIIDDDENGIPRYDAYVPYHIEDEDWVDAELLANIEEGEEPFRLCLKTRDIRAGRPIFNEISLHIQRSRKILVILSPRFVEDNWCHFELNMAHHRVLEEGRNVMILILLEKIPDNKMTLLLRQLYCRVQLLRWPGDGHGQYLFWRRLREELKRPVPLDRRFNVYFAESQVD
ncbi:toll-like receptor 2 type-2 [Amphiura filiformis]|uniref:toll-like receptor 2 type-2 n=1 Tax=Amphiura filiformis TaxID=82378 RepID=UPI003B21CFBA